MTCLARYQCSEVCRQCCGRREYWVQCNLCTIRISVQERVLDTVQLVQYSYIWAGESIGYSATCALFVYLDRREYWVQCNLCTIRISGQERVLDTAQLCALFVYLGRREYWVQCNLCTIRISGQERVLDTVQLVHYSYIWAGESIGYSATCAIFVYLGRREYWVQCNLCTIHISGQERVLDTVQLVHYSYIWAGESIGYSATCALFVYLGRREYWVQCNLCTIRISGQERVLDTVQLVHYSYIWAGESTGYSATLCTIRISGQERVLGTVQLVHYSYIWTGESIGYSATCALFVYLGRREYWIQCNLCTIRISGQKRVLDTSRLVHYSYICWAGESIGYSATFALFVYLCKREYWIQRNFVHYSYTWAGESIGYSASLCTLRISGPARVLDTVLTCARRIPGLERVLDTVQLVL
ncbi:hypothetical protein J6590_038298 [Homalodisca vitripennis]|nr:hypothetical protein J6590_038298 [Homalodisca vitripennis]